MRLTLHPDAERDVAEAAAFYEREGAPAVAARFLKEFRRVGALLQMQPEIGTPRGGGRRGFTMHVFPYTVVYRHLPNEIRITVVKHDRRRPGFGSRRV
ncbi:MAG: type II toxin-antitoxin system RelE/ParE family toxin [Burkholderiales bacterium]|jgi:toxin ParE1/3/4|nr:type II toxin-antitoxin system RelE/ParE family toxin [Burkholderiales bacterium]MBP7522405.1 type II toxin-antitoxin system RelE/ParE family toxin [Leptothrix sp. (in: b-proteobacteria)]